MYVIQLLKQEKTGIIYNSFNDTYKPGVCFKEEIVNNLNTTVFSFKLLF